MYVYQFIFLVGSFYLILVYSLKRIWIIYDLPFCLLSLIILNQRKHTDLNQWGNWFSEMPAHLNIFMKTQFKVLESDTILGLLVDSLRLSSYQQLNLILNIFISPEAASTSSPDLVQQQEHSPPNRILTPCLASTDRAKYRRGWTMAGAYTAHFITAL